MRKRETLPAEESAITVNVNVHCPRYALRTVFCFIMIVPHFCPVKYQAGPDKTSRFRLRNKKYYFGGEIFCQVRVF